MNNKGQTLVIFVIILPIILTVFALIINLGLMYVEKRSITNNLYDSLDYYVDNINDDDVDEKTKVLLRKNIKDINDIKISKTNGYVEISIEKEYNGLFNIISNDTNIKVTKSKKID